MSRLKPRHVEECVFQSASIAEEEKHSVDSVTPRTELPTCTERAKILLFVCQHFELQNTGTESVTQSYNLQLNSIKSCTKESLLTPLFILGSMKASTQARKDGFWHNDSPFVWLSCCYFGECKNKNKKYCTVLLFWSKTMQQIKIKTRIKKVPFAATKYIC